MWIAYTPSDPMSVTAAFGNFQPCENDIVKGQTGFAVYDSIYGWTGTLQTLLPGCCYKYLSSADRSFVYPSSSTISRRDATVVPAIEHFQFDPYKYPSSMVMFAQVADYIPAEGDELGYFVDGECRGGGVRITDSGKTLFYGHFYAQSEGDPVDVVLYKAATQTEHKIAEQFVFQTDGMIGSVEEPQLLHIYVTDVDNLELEQLSLYPSPMQSTLQVRSSQLPDKIELLDVTGVLRMVAHQTRQVDVSGLNAGVYTVRMHFGNRQIVRKMIKQ